MASVVHMVICVGVMGINVDRDITHCIHCRVQGDKLSIAHM